MVVLPPEFMIVSSYMNPQLKKHFEQNNLKLVFEKPLQIEQLQQVIGSLCY